MIVDSSARDIIWNAIGEWGRWQKRSVFLVFLCKTISCWCMAIILFTAPTPQSQAVRCFREQSNASDGESMDGNATWPYRWHVILHPEVIALNDKPFEIDFCDVGADIDAHIDRDHDDAGTWNNTDTVHCDSLRHQPFLHAKRTHFDGICSRNIIAAFTQIFFLFGVLTGGVIAWNLMNL